MGLLDRLKGIREPAPGVAPVSRDELAERLVALNRPDAPYELVASGDGDIVGDWRVADASWRQMLGRAGFTEAYRLTLRLHEDEHAVHAREQSFEADWSLGSGQLVTGSRRKRNAVTVKSHMTARVPGQEPYSFQFDADELRDPVRDTVTAAGWTWRPVRSAAGL